MATRSSFGLSAVFVYRVKCHLFLHMTVTMMPEIEAPIEMLVLIEHHFRLSTKSTKQVGKTTESKCEDEQKKNAQNKIITRLQRYDASTIGVKKTLVKLTLSTK